MCLDPATLAVLTLAASAGSAVMQYQGQQAQADYQDKANDIARKQLAQDEDTQRMDAERQRQQQYQQSASEANANESEAMRERATLEALLGEYGAGNTGDRRLAALGIRHGQDLATMADNAMRQQSELGFGEAATIGATRAKLASLRAGERPSAAGLGLSLAGSALTFGGRMEAINHPQGRGAAGTGSKTTGDFSRMDRK